ITRAQACLTARRQQEQEQVAALEEHPEPPPGEISAKKARRLWIPRALQQTSYVSHMAREVCEDSTKANLGVWAYRGYKKLLNDEVMVVRRMYAEVKLADLSVRERKKALEWLKRTNQEVQRARGHIGQHIAKRERLRALLYPDAEDSSPRTQKRRAGARVCLGAKNAGRKPWKQVEEAAARARLQAARATGTPERPQLAEGVDA
ncbi:MAG: hypothetical protein ACK559_03825, partial [bacterium]